MMKNKVLASFNDVDGTHCVDIFMRPDGSFGFETFRRDAEDGGAWQCLHRHGTARFDDGARALAAAVRDVSWLGDVGPWRW